MQHFGWTSRKSCWLKKKPISKGHTLHYYTTKHWWNNFTIERETKLVVTRPNRWWRRRWVWLYRAITGSLWWWYSFSILIAGVLTQSYIYNCIQSHMQTHTYTHTHTHKCMYNHWNLFLEICPFLPDSTICWHIIAQNILLLLCVFLHTEVGISPLSFVILCLFFLLSDQSD